MDRHHIWTAEERDVWIGKAKDSQHSRGNCGSYGFHVIPKQHNPHESAEDPRRAEMTEALAKLVYGTGNIAYRRLSLGFYEILMGRLMNHAFTSQFLMREFMVVIKGGNAYALLVPNHPDLPFSDLDIAIYINPYLPPELFKQLSSSIDIILLQTKSQYKKTIDHMFFLDKPDPAIKNRWMDDDTIEQFKRDHMKAMRDIGAVSVFEDKEARNACSRNSFMLVNSNANADKVVRIEVPHFRMCDRIPLRRSPVFCSYNETIAIDADTYKRDIGLYRIKFNNMKLEPMDEIRLNLAFDNDSVKVMIEPIVYEDVIGADFIDITIPTQQDSELIDFWNHGRCVYINEPSINMWVCVPDIPTCANDIYKMLHVFDCPEAKREKRQRKYDLLMNIMKGGSQKF